MGNEEEAQAPATGQLLPQHPVQGAFGSKAMEPKLLGIQASSGSLVPTEVRVIQALPEVILFQQASKLSCRGVVCQPCPLSILGQGEVEQTGCGPP